jgi:hypothetical protein
MARRIFAMSRLVGQQRTSLILCEHAFASQDAGQHLEAAELFERAAELALTPEGAEFIRKLAESERFKAAATLVDFARES